MENRFNDSIKRANCARILTPALALWLGLGLFASGDASVFGQQAQQAQQSQQTQQAQQAQQTRVSETDKPAQYASRAKGPRAKHTVLVCPSQTPWSAEPAGLAESAATAGPAGPVGRRPTRRLTRTNPIPARERAPASVSARS